MSSFKRLYFAYGYYFIYQKAIFARIAWISAVGRGETQQTM